MKTKITLFTFLIYLIYTPTIFGQCGAPTALNVINITSNSASIAWTAPTSASILDYVVYVRLTNNAPISSTLPTASSTTTSALVNGFITTGLKPHVLILLQVAGLQEELLLQMLKFI
jgi:Fibronectin type III domain